MAESVTKLLASIIFVLGLSIIPVLVVVAYLIGIENKKAEIRFLDALSNACKRSNRIRSGVVINLV